MSCTISSRPRVNSPETLFITCSDSRVDPNLITNSQPGGAVHRAQRGQRRAEHEPARWHRAALEYAVEVLNVENIIVCGHTQCGALKAILDPESVTHLDYVRRWVESTIDVKQIIEEKYADLGGEERLNAAIQENVLAQLEHLRQYPFVARRMDAGKLQVNGWFSTWVVARSTTTTRI